MALQEEALWDEEEDAWEDEGETEPLSCDECDGLLLLLGVLGNLVHLTCRDCGMQYSIRYDNLPSCYKQTRCQALRV